MSPSHLRYLCFLLLEILIVLAVAPQAFSQAGGVYDLAWSNVGGGGTTSAIGGVYSLNGTFGQPDAGAASGGAYALTGGFGGIANVPPIPSQVVSRKLHNGVPFDINLPLTGNVGIECRSSGGSNDYQVVLTFTAAVTFNSASITSGTGSVVSSSGSGTTTVTVNLTGVTNAQRITVTLGNLSNASGTGNLGVPMGVLIGDTGGNGSVSSTDIGEVKSQSGRAVTAANFRSDVTANGGNINASDISLVKSKSGTQLPPMLNAIKEQNVQMKEQSAEIKQLKDQNKEIAQPKEQLERLQAQVLLQAGNQKLLQKQAVAKTHR